MLIPVPVDDDWDEITSWVEGLIGTGYWRGVAGGDGKFLAGAIQHLLTNWRYPMTMETLGLERTVSSTGKINDVVYAGNATWKWGAIRAGRWYH